MDTLEVFGSEECLSWEETENVIEKLRDDDSFPVSIDILDPIEEEKKFRDYGLVICPSLVYKGEVISVGPPNLDRVKSKIKELTESAGSNSDEK